MVNPTTAAGRACAVCGVEWRPVHRYPKGQQPERSHPVVTFEAEAAAAERERIAARLPTPRPDIEPMRDPVWQGQISGYNAALRDVRAILAEPRHD